jgi:hypothetical protein
MSQGSLVRDLVRVVAAAALATTTTFVIAMATGARRSEVRAVSVEPPITAEPGPQVYMS